jgi:MFS transporter, LPLT family, lysophospholipid transporter
VLAPFVGPLADAFLKGRVMLMANFLKVCAVLLLATGADPTLAIGLAGIGAAIYAPAKYGLITELLSPEKLVRANGYFESTTVCAVIFGTALGGLFVSSLMPKLHLPSDLVWLDTSTSLLTGMLCVLALNGVAMLLSFGVSDSGARYDPHSIHPLSLIRCFFRENLTLWRDSLGGFSLAVTTLVWGVGATLQLIVLRWANEALGLPLSQAAYLQGVTALGVIAGAILASRYVTIHRAAEIMPAGIAMGLLIPVMNAIDSVFLASVLMVLMGALAGFFIVPMNALLQARGCSLLTAGRSIAVQGFNENAGMLVMLAIYTAGTATNISLHALIWCFGVLVTLGMTAVFLSQYKNISSKKLLTGGQDAS